LAGGYLKVRRRKLIGWRRWSEESQVEAQADEARKQRKGQKGSGKRPEHANRGIVMIKMSRSAKQRIGSVNEV